ncbi:hypothetical protein BSLG_002152 [Batrachochytrium salamandrivorans]|nr:hypothetical protein BSLG_002152 [Batrachochytrium salamandrivorans]
MGIPHALKVWQLGRDVARNGPLADPKRLGAIPYDLRLEKRIIPTLMHGKCITFGEQVSEKGGNRSRRVWYPNVQYSALFSRSLDMMIWTRLSTAALREVDSRGGFDEYMVSAQEKHMTCSIAKMYRARILEKYGRTVGKDKVTRPMGIVGSAKDALAKEREKMSQLLTSKYGEAYAK